MAGTRHLDPHQRPPQAIKSIYKQYEKLTTKAIDIDPNIVDFVRGLSNVQQSKISSVGTVAGKTLQKSSLCISDRKILDSQAAADMWAPVYEYEGIPGLYMIPRLLSPETQKDLLSRLMHGILADERHKTNVHLHFRVPYHATQTEKQDGQLHRQTSSKGLSLEDASFFNMSPLSTDLFVPINPNLHRPITISQFLHKKLRWLTLGGQYDWTAKAYPAGEPPTFPEDIAGLIGGLFPAVKPEAAILNFYTPGDTLSVHRDVSEDSDKGLVSISIGCDGVFVVGLGNEVNDLLSYVTIRLRSGDAVYMSGASRFAWHGVPKIIPESCPRWLSDWPADSGEESLPSEYEAWRGWMATKRINLNVRQMKG